MEGCIDDRVLGAYGRDELNDNGKRLLSLVSDNKLALTNTFFSTRKGGISETFIGINSRNDRKRIGYILTLQAPRTRLYMMLRFTPSFRLRRRPIQTITSYTQCSASAVVLHPTDTCERKTESGLSTGRSLDLTENAGSE